MSDKVPLVTYVAPTLVATLKAIAKQESRSLASQTAYVLNRFVVDHSKSSQSMRAAFSQSQDITEQ